MILSVDPLMQTAVGTTVIELSSAEVAVDVELRRKSAVCPALDVSFPPSFVQCKGRKGKDLQLRVLLGKERSSEIKSM